MFSDNRTKPSTCLFHPLYNEKKNEDIKSGEKCYTTKIVKMPTLSISCKNQRSYILIYPHILIRFSNGILKL